MTVRLDRSLGFYENALRLTSQRQQLLASNIANSDTPNFKARDFDFSAAIKDAMNHSMPTSAMEMAQSNSLHLNPDNGLASKYGFLRKNTQNNQDGNTVDMDVERVAFTENALRYEAAISFAHEEIKGLASVVQG